MPLADHGGLVTGLAEQNRERLLLRGNVPYEVENAVHVGVLARDDTSAARGANRIGAERVVEADALLCQTIDRRGRVNGFQQGCIRTNCLRGMIIRHDEENIWLFIRSRYPG